MDAKSPNATTAAVQLHALAWICFCGPGLFNALTSFASGLADPRVAFAGNALVYLSFAACSLLAAALVPAIGVRRALTLGSTGYFVYVASLWNVRNGWFAPLELYYAACVVLGAAAGFLWTAQGLMLLSYPSRETQGESVSSFWIIFNLGATAGGVLSFGLNFNGDSNGRSSSSSRAAESAESFSSGASDGMYAAFLLLMGAGVGLAWCAIKDSHSVIKADGQPVHLSVSLPLSADDDSDVSVWSSWRRGTHNAWEVVSNPHHRRVLLALLPLFAYSNWFYAYHSFYNVAVFNARTSGLTSACYWLAQMAGASIAGAFLDKQGRRSTERRSWQQAAREFLIALLVLSATMWTLGWYVQSQWLHLSYERRLNMDVLTTDASSVLAALLLYITYGLHDALCQVWLYWFMSCLTRNDIVASGCYAGVYKSVQAASAALAWYLGAIQLDPLVQLQINLGLCVVSILCALRCCDFDFGGGKAIARHDRIERSGESAKLLA